MVFTEPPVYGQHLVMMDSKKSHSNSSILNTYLINYVRLSSFCKVKCLLQKSLPSLGFVCTCLYVCVLLCSDFFTRKTNLLEATRGQIFFKWWFFKWLECKNQSCHCIWFIWWVGKLSAARGFTLNCKKLQHCRNFSLLGCTGVWKVLFAMFEK